MLSADEPRRIHLSHDAARFYDFMVANPFFATIEQMMVANPQRFFGS